MIILHHETMQFPKKLFFSFSTTLNRNISLPNWEGRVCTLYIYISGIGRQNKSRYFSLHTILSGRYHMTWFSNDQGHNFTFFMYYSYCWNQQGISQPITKGAIKFDKIVCFFFIFLWDHFCELFMLCVT